MWVSKRGGRVPPLLALTSPKKRKGQPVTQLSVAVAKARLAPDCQIIDEFNHLFAKEQPSVHVQDIVVQHEKQRDKGCEAKGNLSGHRDGLAWRVSFAKGGLPSVRARPDDVLVRQGRLNQSSHVCCDIRHAH
jgi:hypothetical protein